MLERTLSVKEAAVYLKVQPRTVRAWIARGILAASRVGKSYVIPEPEVERMVTPKPAPDAKAGKKALIQALRGCLVGTGTTAEQFFATKRKEADARKRKLEQYGAWR